jgi:hypothetical protein
MNNVTTTTEIQGEIHAVFDLLATARFWVHWRPATTGVGGVTERPFQLGDLVRACAQIGSRVHEGNWRVSEHMRPPHAQLRLPPPPHDPRPICCIAITGGAASCL